VKSGPPEIDSKLRSTFVRSVKPIFVGDEVALGKIQSPCCQLTGENLLSADCAGVLFSKI